MRHTLPNPIFVMRHRTSARASCVCHFYFALEYWNPKYVQLKSLVWKLNVRHISHWILRLGSSPHVSTMNNSFICSSDNPSIMEWIRRMNRRNPTTCLDLWSMSCMKVLSLRWIWMLMWYIVTSSGRIHTTFMPTEQFSRHGCSTDKHRGCLNQVKLARNFGNKHQNYDN